MIKGFKDKGAERLFNREPSRKLPPEIQRIGLRKLRMLKRARTLETYEFLPETAWNLSKGIAWENIVSESTTGGESALFGNKTMSMRLKLWIIIRG